jgi:threonine dehydrogenase-like Zn-dependent dehydrogenase
MCGQGLQTQCETTQVRDHGSPVGRLAHQMASLLPDAVAAKLIERAGVDRLNAFHLAIELVRRGGTISLIGVYGGMADPLPMLTLFDKQVQLRMGQANVRRWADDILPLLTDADPLAVDAFATHHPPLADAAPTYELFQRKQDGAVKILLQP